MDAAKIMWVMYEHPEADFMDMAMRFIDIRKRVYTFPKMGEKAYFINVGLTVLISGRQIFEYYFKRLYSKPVGIVGRQH